MSENVNLASSDAHFAVILRRLDEIDARMRDDREETRSFRRALDATLASQSTRISSLESDRTRVMGFAAGAGAAGGGVGAWLHKLFG